LPFSGSVFLFEKESTMNKTTVNMNYRVIIFTGIAAFALSIVWYSPLLFGNIWEQYRQMPNPGIPKWTMVFAPLREFIVALVLAKLIVNLHLTHWKNTIKLILLLWFAFHAVGMAGAILWDNMQWQLGAVHAGDWLMKMLFMGIVLTKTLNSKRSSSQNQS
jgi:hypothetical protein